MQTAASGAATRLHGVDVSLFSILLLVDSLHFVFARSLVPYFDPAVAATLVLAVGTVEVGVFAAARGRLSFEAIKRHLWFYAAIGALVGFSTALGYASVNYVDTGTASVLGKLTTIFTLLLSVFWLCERLTRAQIAGALLAIAGVLIITFQPGDYLRTGSLLLIASTAMYALHAALVKRYGQDIDFIDFFFARLLFTTLALLLTTVGRPLPTSLPTQAWLLVIAAGTVDVVISRSLYYLALRRLPMSLHAVILTLSPVATTLWGYILFETLPSGIQLIGAGAVLTGVLIATLFRSNR
jgi:drug/metabolite transporter (DMT)-like permease